MERPNLKLPKLDFSGLAIAIALGIIVAVGLYQAQQKGWIPFRQNLSPEPSAAQQENRTIFKEENAIIDVVDQSSHSVVAIGISRRVINPFDAYSFPKKEDSTIGTGFIVSSKQSSITNEHKVLVVTNKHVVSDNSANYSIITNDDKKYEVKKVYRDPILDLAIVEVEGQGLKPLELGNSTDLKVGQTVIAIGNALGRFTNTVTTGIISGLGRAVTAGDPFQGSYERLDNLIQTDAAINPGNSGGPLLNSKGQVVGVNVAVSEGAQNIGFAIPISAVKTIVDEFVEKGKISRPYVGIRYRFISKDVAILNEVPQGAYIQEVISSGPADKSGVEAGDIVIKINGQSVDSENKISDEIVKKDIGSQMILDLWRDGKELKINVTLEELPTE